MAYVLKDQGGRTVGPLHSTYQEAFNDRARRNRADCRVHEVGFTEPVDEPDGEPSCTNPGGHSWAYSGTAYGGDDESYHGEGRCYCAHCGADGDA